MNIWKNEAYISACRNQNSMLEEKKGKLENKKLENKMSYNLLYTIKLCNNVLYFLRLEINI